MLTRYVFFLAIVYSICFYHVGLYNIEIMNFLIHSTFYNVFCYRKCFLKRCQLNYQELYLFFSKINDLPCIIPQLPSIKEWVNEAKKNQQETRDLLLEDTFDLKKISNCWLNTLSLGLISMDTDRLRDVCCILFDSVWSFILIIFS